MRKFSHITMLILALGLVASCTKIKESPDPDTSSSSGGSGGGGGGNQGNPDVYIGLWKLTEKTIDGTSVFGTLSSTFTVHLKTGGLSTWKTYDTDGTETGSEDDNYTLNTSSSPATVNFQDRGTREVISKTGSQIVWQFNDPDFGGLLVEETLTKQ